MRNSELQIVRDDLSGLLAHDLKTPLAAISMNLDFALSELEGHISESVHSALDDCRHANGRAVRIVSDMADAVRLAVGERRAVLVDIALGGMVQEVVRRATEAAQGRGVHIVSSVDATVVSADTELLARALDRLVEAALRHARTTTQIEIDQVDCAVTIRVETMSDGRTELGMRTLATYFAEAALRAQGGSVWTEPSGGGELVYRITLAPAEI